MGAEGRSWARKARGLRAGREGRRETVAARLWPRDCGGGGVFERGQRALRGLVGEVGPASRWLLEASFQPQAAPRYSNADTPQQMSKDWPAPPPDRRSWEATAPNALSTGSLWKNSILVTDMCSLGREQLRTRNRKNAKNSLRPIFLDNDQKDRFVPNNKSRPRPLDISLLAILDGLILALAGWFWGCLRRDRSEIFRGSTGRTGRTGRRWRIAARADRRLGSGNNRPVSWAET